MKSVLIPLLTLIPLAGHAATLSDADTAKFRQAAEKGRVPAWLLDPALIDLGALLDNGQPMAFHAQDGIVSSAIINRENAEPGCVYGAVSFRKATVAVGQAARPDYLSMGLFCKRAGVWKLSTALTTNGTMPPVEKPKAPAQVAEQAPAKPARPAWQPILQAEFEKGTDVPAEAVKAGLGLLAQALEIGGGDRDNSEGSIQFRVRTFDNPPGCKAGVVMFRSENDSRYTSSNPNFYPIIYTTKFCFENGTWSLAGIHHPPAGHIYEAGQATASTKPAAPIAAPSAPEPMPAPPSAATAHLPTAPIETVPEPAATVQAAPQPAPPIAAAAPPEPEAKPPQRRAKIDLK